MTSHVLFEVDTRKVTSVVQDGRRAGCESRALTSCCGLFFLQKIRLLAIGRVYGDPRAIHPFPFLNPTFQLLIYFRRPDPPFYFQAFLWRGSVNGAKLSAFGWSGQVRATEMSPPGSPDLDFFNSTMSSYQPVDKYGCFIYFLFYFLRSPFLLKAVI